jgi:Fe-S oxidoreductase
MTPIISLLQAEYVSNKENNKSMKLEDHLHDAATCIRCSNCKWIDQNYTRSHRFSQTCPINTRYGFDAYSGGGMLTLAKALLDKKLEFTPRFLDVIYKCTLCGACDVRCKRNLDIEVLLTLEALRSKAVQEGYGPLGPHKTITQWVKETGNRYGSSNKKRLAWLPEGVVPEPKADVLYFVGCNSSFVQTEIARSTTKILMASGIPFKVLPDEWCCGQPLLSTGQEDAARGVVEHNIKAIEASGVTTVIASCAECYQTLKVKYPRLLDKKTEAINFNVLHIVEYAEQLLKSGTLRLGRQTNIKMTYHDPCHLGRLSEAWKPWHGVFGKFSIPEPPREMRRGTFGIYEPPRELLKGIRGLEIVEMERAKDQAWCCGAGGAVKDAFKDFALWTARERLEEAIFTGAEAVVSCCPWCEENLRDAARQNGRGIQIYDIVQLVADAI